MRSLAAMPDDVEYGRGDLLANSSRAPMAEQFVGQEMLISQKTVKIFITGIGSEKQFRRGGLSGCHGWQNSSAGGEKRRYRQPEKAQSLFLAAYPDCASGWSFRLPYARICQNRKSPSCRSTASLRQPEAAESRKEM